MVLLCMGLPTAIAPVEVLPCAGAKKIPLECILVHVQD